MLFQIHRASNLLIIHFIECIINLLAKISNFNTVCHQKINHTHNLIQNFTCKIRRPQSLKNRNRTHFQILRYEIPANCHHFKSIILLKIHLSFINLPNPNHNNHLTPLFFLLIFINPLVVEHHLRYFIFLYLLRRLIDHRHLLYLKF